MSATRQQLANAERKLELNARLRRKLQAQMNEISRKRGDVETELGKVQTIAKHLDQQIHTVVASAASSPNRASGFSVQGPHHRQKFPPPPEEQHQQTNPRNYPSPGGKHGSPGSPGDQPNRGGPPRRDNAKTPQRRTLTRTNSRVELHRREKLELLSRQRQDAVSQIAEHERVVAELGAHITHLKKRLRSSQRVTDSALQAVRHGRKYLPRDFDFSPVARTHHLRSSLTSGYPAGVGEHDFGSGGPPAHEQVGGPSSLVVEHTSSGGAPVGDCRHPIPPFAKASLLSNAFANGGIMSTSSGGFPPASDGMVGSGASSAPRIVPPAPTTAHSNTKTVSDVGTVPGMKPNLYTPTSTKHGGKKRSVSSLEAALAQAEDCLRRERQRSLRK